MESMSEFFWKGIGYMFHKPIHQYSKRGSREREGELCTGMEHIIAMTRTYKRDNLSQTLVELPAESSRNDCWLLPSVSSFQALLLSRPCKMLGSTPCALAVSSRASQRCCQVVICWLSAPKMQAKHKIRKFSTMHWRVDQAHVGLSSCEKAMMQRSNYAALWDFLVTFPLLELRRHTCNNGNAQFTVHLSAGLSPRLHKLCQ